MLPVLAVSLGLLVQAAANPQTVHVWRDDSTAYVTLRRPGHLVVLHVDAIGRIGVLLPAAPDEETAARSSSPVAVTLPPEAQGNPTTFIAIESRWPFDFSALRLGATWDYDGAWLLQPTGGDPLAALLDIADRITDGRPYDYGVATYSRAGLLVARGPVTQPDVCLSCVRRGTAVAATAAPIATNAVDCSNASLTSAFCGVNSGTVSITNAPAPASQPPQVVYQPAPQAVYVPYFVPIGRGFRSRFEQPMPPPVPRSTGAAYPVAPRLVVPSSSQIGTLRHR